MAWHLGQADSRGNHVQLSRTVEVFACEVGQLLLDPTRNVPAGIILGHVLRAHTHTQPNVKLNRRVSCCAKRVLVNIIKI